MCLTHSLNPLAVCLCRSGRCERRIWHRKLLALITLTTVAGLVAMSAGQAPILNTEPCNALSIGEVADALNFTVLADLLDATRLYNALNGTRYVLLAPTDTAFTNALRATGLTAERLLSRPDLVSQLLSYHVVNSTNAATWFANKVNLMVQV